MRNWVIAMTLATLALPQLLSHSLRMIFSHWKLVLPPIRPTRRCQRRIWSESIALSPTPRR